MALSVTYEHDDFPKGTEFEIVGLGIVPNGKKVTLTEDQERAFVQTNLMTVKEALSGSEALKVEGTAEFKGDKTVETTNDEGGEN